MNLLPSMDQSNAFIEDAHGHPSGPYFPERLPFKDPSWNQPELSSEQPPGWVHHPHRPRYGNRIPTWWPYRHPQTTKSPDPEQDCIRNSFNQETQATSYESAQEARSSQNHDCNSASEESAAAMNAAWALAEYGAHHPPLTTYPSLPGNNFSAKDSSFDQSRSEHNSSPRYVIESASRQPVRVPTISLQPAETYGEGVDFPDLFDGELLNLREDSTSPATRSKATSSPTVFENFASPAFSTEGFSEVPTVDPKPMFVTSQYWDNLESSELQSTDSSSWWDHQQPPPPLSQPSSTDNDWSALSDEYPLFGYQEAPSLPFNEPLTELKSWNEAVLSFPQDTSQALEPPRQSQTFQSSHIYYPCAHEATFGCDSIDSAPTFTYPQFDGQLTASRTGDSAQGSSPVRFFDRGNPMPYHAVSRSERKSYERTRMNLLLVKWKKAGMSYKEIKAKGGFRDAESTLRGRYRTLTKNKEERVRKPEWQDHDVDLLVEAVEKYSNPSESGISGRGCTDSGLKANKISWKNVAQHIRLRGGSYLYGNATCKKKWKEVRGRLPDVGSRRG